MNNFNNNFRGNSSGTSFFEQLTYWVVKTYLYDKYEVQLHYKLDTYEFDIAIPELNILIECQSRLHVNSVEMDKVKQSYCSEHNIRLITIMNWQDSSKVQINYQKDYIEFGCASKCIRDSIQKVLLSNNILDSNKIKLQKNEHSRYIAATYALLMLITNKKVDIEYFSKLPWTKIWQTSINNSIDATLSFENSLASRPELVKEFRGLIKYPEIQPRSISLYSHEPADWECLNCNYKWKAIIENRTFKNTKCPKCSAKIAGKKVSITKSICKDISKSFYAKYKSLVPFIKANSMQEKEQTARSIYASSNIKTITLVCPHCQKDRIIYPCNLRGKTNIKCKECYRHFIE